MTLNWLTDSHELLGDKIELRKAIEIVTGTYGNGNDTPMADFDALKRAVDLLASVFDRDDLSQADKDYLTSVWQSAFEGQY